MSTFALTYRFSLPNGRQRVFPLQLASDSAELTPASATDAPAWTKLEFHQCAGCPLSAAEVTHCPAALQMSGLIDEFSDVVSFDQVQVTVETEERSVSSTVSAQQGLASLMGLLMAASSCPRTAVFRPMARFHLPFSTEAETAYRVATMYLLAQHFGALQGDTPDVALRRLEEVYRGIHAVNRGMAQRLRAATRQDAIVNAVVLLDVNTSLMPVAIHEILNEVRPAFTALMAAIRTAKEPTTA
jgi:hypothetical protein